MQQTLSWCSKENLRIFRDNNACPELVVHQIPHALASSPGRWKGSNKPSEKLFIGAQSIRAQLMGAEPAEIESAEVRMVWITIN